MRIAQHGEPSVRSAAAASLPHAAATISRWPGGPQFLAERFEVGLRAACVCHAATLARVALRNVIFPLLCSFNVVGKCR